MAANHLEAGNDTRERFASSRRRPKPLFQRRCHGGRPQQVYSASLWDMGRSPPQIADPAIIKITCGTADDPDPPDNGDAADLVALRPPFGTLSVSRDARIGQQFKLDICVVACDGCAGRKIRMCDCVVIAIAEC